MTRSQLIQLAQEFVKVTVARFRRRRFEGAAEGGSDAGMGGWEVDSNDPSIHVESVRHVLFTF